MEKTALILLFGITLTATAAEAPSIKDTYLQLQTEAANKRIVELQQQQIAEMPLPVPMAAAEVMIPLETPQPDPTELLDRINNLVNENDRLRLEIEMLKLQNCNQ